uniref:Uncharacterized protein n=1 Tax=Oryza rufipogon TaxID=4529 RepID=A0A0E0MV40_ORYRU
MEQIEGGSGRGGEVHGGGRSRWRAPAKAHIWMGEVEVLVAVIVLMSSFCSGYEEGCDGSHLFQDPPADHTVHHPRQTRTPRMLCNRFCQRMEDDVHSTTSLQERAEKRKKFYQKSEEKIHAKELEQTQAKSKQAF